MFKPRRSSFFVSKRSLAGRMKNTHSGNERSQRAQFPDLEIYLLTLRLQLQPLVDLTITNQIIKAPYFSFQKFDILAKSIVYVGVPNLSSTTNSCVLPFLI